ncbi:MAG: M42 family peptidase [Chloroflexota bacterium]
MNQDHIDLLTELSNAVGIPGHEQNIRTILRNRCAAYVDEFQDDPLGNLTMIKLGQGSSEKPRHKIMLAAHTDEIGGIVLKIDRGFIHFTNVGGLNPQLLLGQEVTVFGRQTYHGVIASKPPHFANMDRNRYPDLETYQIDLGLPAKTIAENVRVGDVVAMKQSATTLMGNTLTGKAFDDRASVVAVVICLAELTRLHHDWDVYAVATSREEVGLHGAITSAYRINPDVAIAIDVTFADSPGISDGHGVSLGKGPVITQGANIHPIVCKTLRETASSLEMNVQSEFEAARTGTDAWAIQTSQDGIPTGLIGLPLRYMHSTVETINSKDIERAGRLMAHFIANLNEDFVSDLIPQDGLEDEL